MNKKGFTLTEIVVATVILALLASGVFSVMVSLRYLVRRTRNRTRAVEVARFQIERMRQYVRADTWWSLAANPLFPSGTWSNWTVFPGDSSFDWRYIVDNVANSDCRSMTVQVRWNETRLQ